jgi:hypothetical protein
MLSHPSISKATVSLSVGFVTAGDTASVSELSNNSLFTALNACTVESLIAHLRPMRKKLVTDHDGLGRRMPFFVGFVFLLTEHEEL